MDSRCVVAPGGLIAALKGLHVPGGSGGEWRKSKSLEIVMALHSLLVGNTCIPVANLLMSKYAACGSAADCQRVFNGMPTHDVASWTILMSAYVAGGEARVALNLFVAMQPAPDSRTFVVAFKACACLGTAAADDQEVFQSPQLANLKAEPLEKGMALHAESEKRGCWDTFIGNALVDMYSKCGSVQDAELAFTKLAGARDSVSWNSIILGYANNEQPEMALDVFQAMLTLTSCGPNSRTFVSALKACSRLAAKEENDWPGLQVKVKALELAMALHQLCARQGCDAAGFVANSLLDVYAKCGSVADARIVFDRIRVTELDAVLWSTIILSYAEAGDGRTALNLFQSMTCNPDARSFFAALRACISLAATKARREALETGMALHSQAANLGFTSTIFLANVLIDLYAKCGCMQDARAVFDSIPAPDLVSWTSLLTGYVENDQASLALDLFDAMQAQFRPNARALLAALKACTSLAASASSPDDITRWLEFGMALHSRAEEEQLADDKFLASALVDMYVKCKALEDAKRVFERIPKPDGPTWSSIILGCVQNGEAEVAMDLFTSSSCPVNSLTCAAALQACGSMAALQAGKAVHALILRLGIEADAVLETCTVDFYAKCGSAMAHAQLMFDSSLAASSDLIAWTALIAGHGRESSADVVLSLFDCMQVQGVRPNGVTLLSILTACSHAGLVDKAKSCFELMQRRYGVRPQREHYHCMIDLLGRANQVEDAFALVKSMPFKPDSVTWTTLLAACTHLKDPDLVRKHLKHSFHLSLHLHKQKPAAYVLMANIEHPS